MSSSPGFPPANASCFPSGDQAGRPYASIGAPAWVTVTDPLVSSANMKSLNARRDGGNFGKRLRSRAGRFGGSSKGTVLV